ncbi:MAG: hypothetical protein JWL62_3423, partial [Hyphomicrobiales bacterium]|nr:hypothetical protein [Hyphomicrobiales bacterium]
GWTGVISGTIALSSGLLILALAAILAQLEAIASRLDGTPHVTMRKTPEAQVSYDEEAVAVPDVPRPMRPMPPILQRRAEPADAGEDDFVPPPPREVAVESLPIRQEEPTAPFAVKPITLPRPAERADVTSSSADRLRQMQDLHIADRETERGKAETEKREMPARSKLPPDFKFKFSRPRVEMPGDVGRPSPVALRGTLHQDTGTEPERAGPSEAPEADHMPMGAVAEAAVENSILMHSPAAELEPQRLPPPPEADVSESQPKPSLFTLPWKRAQKPPVPTYREAQPALNAFQPDAHHEVARVEADTRSIEELEAMVAELEAQSAEYDLPEPPEEHPDQEELHDEPTREGHPQHEDAQDAHVQHEGNHVDDQVEEHSHEPARTQDDDVHPEPAVLQQEEIHKTAITPERPSAVPEGDWLERALSGIDEDPVPPAFVPKSVSHFAAKAEQRTPIVQPSPEAPVAALPAGSEPEVTIIGRHRTQGGAYVMYSDGSIDAETDAGNFRFDSLAELKRFIERGA